MRSKNSSNGRDRSFIETARREQLISCAIASLAEDGFVATSIASVATRAGIAKSVVLYYFTSKASLLEAVVESVYAQAAASLTVVAEPGGDNHPVGEGREQLLTYIRECTLFASEQRAQTAALTEIFTNLRTDNGSRRYGAAENAPMITFVADLLRAGQDDGSFGAFDVTLTAITIRATIDALPAVFAAQPDLDGSAMADHLAQLFDSATRRDVDH